MIIIYNLSGLLVGLAGIAASIAVIAATGRAGIGVLVGSLVWIGLGFWWRSRSTGARTSYGDPVPNAWPSVFFIPLPFIGIATALISVLLVFAELKGGSPNEDPRHAKLKADEDQLQAADAGGNAELSRLVRQQITKIDTASTVNVFTRIEGDRVLVLAKLSKLKDVKDGARQRILDLILETVRQFPAAQGKNAYVGIKGRVLYGIVHVPPNTTKIGETVPDELLHDFYGPAPGAASPTPSAASTPSTPKTGSAQPSRSTGSASPSRSAVP
jgi:hypothetical protein